MSRSRVSRLLGSALLLSSIALPALALPASAATVTTRWVDDDGKAGPTSCSGTKTAYKTIQKGVNAANTDDIVKVCPGTYQGWVKITGSRDGLVLRAATSTKPRVKAVDDFDAGATTIISVDSVDDVTIKGLDIRPLQSATSHSYCSFSNGIKATNAKHISITGNSIRPSGSPGFCGVADGILLEKGTTGTVSSNTVKDYRNAGVSLHDEGTDVTVTDTDITYALSGVPTGPAVLVDSTARGIIKDGVLVGLSGYASAGVHLNGAASTSVVRGMDITTFATDIRVEHVNGGTVRDNDMHGGQVGLSLLDADNVVAYGNTSSGATVNAFFISGGTNAGADATKTSGANVQDNDFRSTANGSQKDCQGGTTTAWLAANNTFDQNKGTSDPVELCDYIAPPK